jgi:hypothetical protein
MPWAFVVVVVVVVVVVIVLVLGGFIVLILSLQGRRIACPIVPGKVLIAIRQRSWRSGFPLSWTRGIDRANRRRPRGLEEVLEVEYALLWALFKPWMSSGWNSHRMVVWRSPGVIRRSIDEGLAWSMKLTV